jgi:hypothetical protein
MTCAHCGKDRILNISAKCSDLCHTNLGDLESNGYVPEGLGIGNGDYLEFKLCLDCGQVQGKFPIPDEAVKSVLKLTNTYESDEVLEEEEWWLP